MHGQHSPNGIGAGNGAVSRFFFNSNKRKKFRGKPGQIIADMCECQIEVGIDGEGNPILAPAAKLYVLDGKNCGGVPVAAVPCPVPMDVYLESLVKEGDLVTLTMNNGETFSFVDVDTDTQNPNATFEITNPNDGDGIIVVTVTPNDGTAPYELTFPEPPLAESDGIHYSGQATISAAGIVTFPTVNDADESPAAPQTLDLSSLISGPLQGAGDVTVTGDSVSGYTIEYTDVDAVYTAGNNMTITGAGTPADPYVLTATDSIDISTLTGSPGEVYTHTANGISTDIRARDNNDGSLNILGCRAVADNRSRIVTGNANMDWDQAEFQAAIDANVPILIAELDIECPCAGVRPIISATQHVRGIYDGDISPANALDAIFQFNLGVSANDPTMTTGLRGPGGVIAWDSRGNPTIDEEVITWTITAPPAVLGTNTYRLYVEPQTIDAWNSGRFNLNQYQLNVIMPILRCC